MSSLLTSESAIEGIILRRDVVSRIKFMRALLSRGMSVRKALEKTGMSRSTYTKYKVQIWGYNRFVNVDFSWNVGQPQRLAVEQKPVSSEPLKTYNNASSPKREFDLDKIRNMVKFYMANYTSTKSNDYSQKSST